MRIPVGPDTQSVFSLARVGFGTLAQLGATDRGLGDLIAARGAST